MTFKSREAAREAARRGGHARAAKLRATHAAPAPYSGTPLDLMDLAGFGASWDAWRALLRAIYRLPMQEADRGTFEALTGRTRVPAALREVFTVAGRRSGKTRIGALLAVHAAVSRNYAELLAPGELAVIPAIAAERRQSRILLGYVRGLCRLPALAPYVKRMLRDSIEFVTGARIECVTASNASPRSTGAPLAVCDELAYWASDELAADPDREILRAVRPSLGSIPGSLLFAASSPFAQSGELFRAFERHFGHDESDSVLVVRAPTLTLNPTFSAETVAEAMEADPVAGASEYGAEFRQDISNYVDPENVRAVTPEGIRERPPETGRGYVAFFDGAGGSGQDSAALGIAYSENGRACLALCREWRPKFSPNAVVAECAGILKSYGISECTGDRFGPGFLPEAFAAAGINYRLSELTASEIFRSAIAGINSGTMELLDIPRLTQQIVGLERRSAGAGRENIGHVRGGHDDTAVAALGALRLAAQSGATVSFDLAGMADGLRTTSPLGDVGGQRRWGSDAEDDAAAQWYREHPFEEGQ